VDPHALSLVAVSLLPPLILWQRNRILDVTCTGVFLVSQIVFVVIGVLAAPWLMAEDLPRLFSLIKWDLISPADLARAIVIVFGGTVLVVMGGVSADATAAVLGRRRLTWGHLLRRPARLRAGFSAFQLDLAYVALLLVAIAMLVTKWQILVAGLVTGYIGGDVAEQYASRGSMQELGMVYYLIVFNALPFLTVIRWMLSRLGPAHGGRLQALVMVSVTSILLLATFEKRPFVLFLISLMIGHHLAEIYSGRAKGGRPSSLPLSPAYWVRHLPWTKLGTWVGLPFVILVGFYYLSTNIAAVAGSPLGAVMSLAEVTVSRIFGRLAVEPILYATYFPGVDSHYGLSNIGKWADLTGQTYYPDTILVARHFTGLGWGSGAIGAVVDFYGAFGWPGWAAGCFVLGVLLNALDRWLQSLPLTLLNRGFYFFATVFAYYLSQASVARSLSSYGGGTFVLLWLVLSIRLLPRLSTASPPSAVPSAVEH